MPLSTFLVGGGEVVPRPPPRPPPSPILSISILIGNRPPWHLTLVINTSYSILASHGKDDDANADADSDLDVLATAYHRLLLRHLHVERRSYEEERDDRVGATGGGGGRGSSCSSRRRPQLRST